MSDYYNEATVYPELPASLFSEADLRSLAMTCGLECKPEGDVLFFFASDHFRERGYHQDDYLFNCIELLQEKLRKLDEKEYPYITIEAARSCSKIREDAFGGYAYFITRDEIRYISTSEWLHEQVVSFEGGSNETIFLENEKESRNDY